MRAGDSLAACVARSQVARYERRIITFPGGVIRSIFNHELRIGQHVKGGLEIVRVLYERMLPDRHL